MGVVPPGIVGAHVSHVAISLAHVAGGGDIKRILWNTFVLQSPINSILGVRIRTYKTLN